MSPVGALRGIVFLLGCFICVSEDDVGLTSSEGSFLLRGRVKASGSTQAVGARSFFSAHTSHNASRWHTTTLGATHQPNSSPRTWLECTYDWTQKIKYHVASRQWRFIPHLGNKLEEFRHSSPLTNMTEHDKWPVILKLLSHVIPILDDLHVNWYVGAGTMIGMLRSQSFIPWDEDVDILMKTADRWKLFEFVRNHANATRWDNEGVAIALDEDSQVAMVAFADKNEVRKVLWIDVLSELAIDFCFDCSMDISEDVLTQRATFGPLEVNIVSKIWDVEPVIHGESGVDYHGHTIAMKTSESSGGPAGWSCQLYQCEQAPTALESGSFRELFKSNPAAMFKPISFSIGDDGLARCELPQDFTSCLPSDFDSLHEVKVLQCTA